MFICVSDSFWKWLKEGGGKLLNVRGKDRFEENKFRAWIRGGYKIAINRSIPRISNFLALREIEIIFRGTRNDISNRKAIRWLKIKILFLETLLLFSLSPPYISSRQRQRLSFIEKFHFIYGYNYRMKRIQSYRIKWSQTFS